MVVKVKRKEILLGKEYETKIYLPEDVLLTRDRRLKADRLDEILENEAAKINKEFEQIKEEIKKSNIQKWRWLGKKINFILKNISSIEKTDIDNNVIWPAIGQYLRDELKRGLDDKKRSGTKNDHYRKCWALATIPGTEWISSWVGWDAFTDRGDQLVYSKKLMPLMKQKFENISPQLSSKEYQFIAKLLIKQIPTKAKLPTNIDAMDVEDIKKIIDAVYTEFLRMREDIKNKNQIP